MRKDMTIDNIIFEVQTRIQDVKVAQEESLLFQHIQANWELLTNDASRIPRFCTWRKPPEHTWALSCDGSLTQNRAGYRG